jgi:RNA polymerase sigma-70 factor (sigma-E family)
VTGSRGQGRDEAFSAFVLARQGRLRAIAYSLCGDWHDADDLLQTALTKLYVAWPRVTRDGSPEAYVRRILVHVDIDNHRRRSRRVRTVSLETGPDVPGREAMGTEERSAMIQALQSLPQQQRKVVVLRHWLGLSVRETAAELGITEGTVKSHSSRGLAALEAVLAPQGRG